MDCTVRPALTGESLRHSFCYDPDVRDDTITGFVPPDTTSDADAVQLEVYRRLGGPGRVAAMFRLNTMVRTIAQAGIRQRHPGYDDLQVEWAWQRLVLGDALVREAFPGRGLIEP